MIWNPSKFHSLNFSVVLMYTSNRGCLSTASFLISLIILNKSSWVLAPAMTSSVPSRLSGDSFKSSSLALPVYSQSEEHTSELQSLAYLVCRLLLEKKKKIVIKHHTNSQI